MAVNVSNDFETTTKFHAWFLVSCVVAGWLAG
jgi:hypothetical protein